MAERVNPFAYIFNKVRPGNLPVLAEVISPVKKEDKKDYKAVIYELETSSPNDLVLAKTTGEALRRANFDLILDVEKRKENHKIIVKSKSDDHHDTATEGALFLGLMEATRTILETPNQENLPTTPENIDQLASLLLNQIVGNEEFYTEFKKYYGGLRWSTDQDNFTASLFTHGTDYDGRLLDGRISYYHLRNVAEVLGMNLPYEQTRDWYDLGTEAILKKYPQLNHLQLENPDFRATTEGQQLEKAYAKICGEIVANAHKRSERFDMEGNEVSKSMIPLHRFPIIEALVVDEVTQIRPRAKYNFGASEMIGFIFSSDSLAAHQALVDRIIIRQPKELRRVSDGPDEFEHKQRHIHELLGQYKHPNNEVHRQILKDDLLAIITAFTEGEIVANVRAEWETTKPEYRGYPREVRGVKEIMTAILEVAIASSDEEIYNKAMEIIIKFCPRDDKDVAIFDPLALNRADLMLVLFDGLNGVTDQSNPSVFQAMANLIFRNDEIGEKFRGFIEDKIKAILMGQIPEVREAYTKWRKLPSDLGLDKNPEKELAWEEYEEIRKEATDLLEKVHKEENDLLINLLTQLLNSEALINNQDAKNMFTGFTKRIKFSDHDMVFLPEEYQRLIDISLNPMLPEERKADILWHIYEQFKYTYFESAYLLVPVLLDMYKVILGEVNNVKMPTKSSRHAIAAATYLVHEKGSAIFKSATPEQLNTFDQYAAALKVRANQIKDGALLVSGDEIEVDTEGLDEWQKEAMNNISDVMHELKTIEKNYEGFLHLEAVKSYGHVYYPWMLNQFTPFWQGMQWETSKGNNPTMDIRSLYQVLDGQIKNKLALRDEYKEGFDCLLAGNLDLLLKECYERMVIPHDIKNNGTVWQKGLPFLHIAVSFMPLEVYKQIITKYEGTSFGKYIVGAYRQTHERN